MIRPDSCLTCKRVMRCKHAPEVALSIFLRVRVLTTAPAIFEATAQNCPDYGRKPQRRRKPGGQEEFAF